MLRASAEKPYATLAPATATLSPSVSSNTRRTWLPRSSSELAMVGMVCPSNRVGKPSRNRLTFGLQPIFANGNQNRNRDRSAAGGGVAGARGPSSLSGLEPVHRQRLGGSRRRCAARAHYRRTGE